VKKTKTKLIHKIVKKRLIKKGASSDFYKSELPEHIFSAITAAKETIALSLVLFIILEQSNFNFFEIRLLLLIFLSLLFIYKIFQRTLIAWQKLSKLNRIIASEKFEIEHHRKQERKELEQIYSAKGFSGKLLDDVIETLMADDNRLLQVMIEEEMGLTLGQFEHPLKQGLFAGIGVLFTSLFVMCSLFLGTRVEFFLFLAACMMIVSAVTIKEEKSNLSFLIFWNLAALVFLGFAAYFLTDFIQLIYYKRFN
jgi:hypothetical protein